MWYLGTDRWKKILATDVAGSLVANHSLRTRLAAILPSESRDFPQDITKTGTGYDTADTTHNKVLSVANTAPALLRLLYKYSNAVLRKLLLRLKVELAAFDNAAFNLEVSRYLHVSVWPRTSVGCVKRYFSRFFFFLNFWVFVSGIWSHTWPR